MRAVALLCAGVLVTAAGTAGCAAARGAAPSGAATGPQGVQAEAVADQEFGLLAAGDWPDAWKLWTGSAKQVLTQAGYVQLNTQCRPRLGVPYVIWQAERTGPLTVLVSWRRGSASGVNAMRYEHGAWKYAPSAAELAGYRLGVAKLVARLKAEKACQ
jgi:hypothetical protein